LDDKKTLNIPFNTRLPRVLFKKIKANVYNRDRDYFLTKECKIYNVNFSIFKLLANVAKI